VKDEAAGARATAPRKLNAAVGMLDRGELRLHHAGMQSRLLKPERVPRTGALDRFDRQQFSANRELSDPVQSSFLNQNPSCFFFIAVFVFLLCGLAKLVSPA
jgi:hypothetical protein